MLLNAFRVLAVDDRRAYRGIDLLVAALHIAEQVDGVARSQKVAVMLPTSGVFGAAASGVWATGRVVVPVNYLLESDQMEFVFADSGVDTLVTSRAFLEALGIEAPIENVVFLEDLPLKSVPTPRWPAVRGRDDLAVVLYTSGTSGMPKGVMLTHGNLLSNVRQMTEHVHFTKRDVFVGVLPQFHSFGLTALTLVPLISGAKAVYSARFMPKKIVGLVRDHGATVFLGIPSMYNALGTVKSATPEEFASIRIAISGGEPLPECTASTFFERFGIEINEGYGLTETSPVTHVKLPGEAAPGSVGRALPEIDQRIVDAETGVEQPTGADGELRLKGPNIMRGYLGRPDETGKAFDDQGRFRTGDIARVDERGFLWITGRLKEMMIVGGENVFPREIETVLEDHPDVCASGVVSEADPMRGEVPVAFVESADGCIADPDSVRDWCRERLAGYKVPRRVIVLDELPRNPTGKILRRKLAEQLRSETKAG